MFGDAVVATAILDRLLHHSSVITIRDDSYRRPNPHKRLQHKGVSSVVRKGGQIFTSLDTG